MDYNVDSGWHQPRIIPYQPIVLDPAAKVFHYGQTIFEGLKAYRTEDGRVLLFRPHKNFKRMNRSNMRLSIPQIDEQFALEALRQLIQLDQDWIPASAGTSLYIRPFVSRLKLIWELHPPLLTSSSSLCHQLALITQRA